jgi:hypothetical protein
MRHLAIILALLAAACAPAGMNGASGTRAYGSQQAADAVLAALGRDNPSCRMWTNWQSLCSRTGPGMSTYCKQDPGFPVQPSEPFCVSQRVPLGTTYGGQFDTPEQRRSRNRFCDLFAGETGSVREQLGPMPICELYAAKRPFDGRRPEAMAHPLCPQWRQVTPETAAVLGPDACIAWEEPLPCPQVIGNAYRFPDNSTLVMPTVRDFGGQAVWGIVWRGNRHASQQGYYNRSFQGRRRTGRH